MDETRRRFLFSARQRMLDHLLAAGGGAALLSCT